jgi:purine nucleoside permease
MTIEFIAITDETNTCEKCGKTNLKRVVVLKVDGEFIRVGTDCAAKMLRQAHGKNAHPKSYLEQVYNAGMTARKCLVNHPADKVAEMLWNRYGLSAEAKDGAVVIYTDRSNIKETITITA